MSSTPLSHVLKMLKFYVKRISQKKKKIPVNGILGAIYELKKGSAWPAVSGCPTGSGVLRGPVPSSCQRLSLGSPGRKRFFTIESRYFQVDPIDSVNHFLNARCSKGQSYLFPILLIAWIDSHN